MSKKNVIRRCAMCGITEGKLTRCEGGYICDPCVERGHAGRDTTARIAKAHMWSMSAQAEANRLRRRGDMEAAAVQQHRADQFAQRADALAQVTPQAEIALGEVVPTDNPYIRDTLRTPDSVALDASAQRIDLLARLGTDAVALAVDAANSIGAQNSLEKMLVHQLAIAHKAALESADRACFETGAAEKARLLNVSVRMIEAFQRGLLTMQRLRTGGNQTIVVQRVTVAEGGQAIVGNVQTGEGSTK